MQVFGTAFCFNKIVKIPLFFFIQNVVFDPSRLTVKISRNHTNIALKLKLLDFRYRNYSLARTQNDDYRIRWGDDLYIFGTPSRPSFQTDLPSPFGSSRCLNRSKFIGFCAFLDCYISGARLCIPKFFICSNPKFCFSPSVG